MFESQYLFLFLALVGFGAFTQGFTGIGFGITVLAGMGFTTWDFEKTTVVLNLILPVLNFSIIWISRKESRIDWSLVGIILAGEALGVPLGYWFILALGQHPVFRIAFGLVLALFAANELFRPRLKKGLPRSAGFGAGILGGFLAGGFTAPGPPLTLFVYSHLPNPKQAKGTLQIVFVSATFIRLVYIFWLGPGVTPPVFEIAGYALPLLVVFMLMGHRLSTRVSNTVFLKTVYTFIGFAGLINLVRGILQYLEYSNGHL